MNTEAYKLARKTLRTAVREYGWHRSREYGVQPFDTREMQKHHYRYGPGKFEGEHWSIVHFYQAMLDGGADETIDGADGTLADLFNVDDTERAAFGIPFDVAYVALSYSGQGFVSMENLTMEQYEELMAEED